MRNYIKELTDRGYKYKDISIETGLSIPRLSNIARGVSKIHSGTKVYESVRNLSRRISYQEMREWGASVEESTRLRRPLFVAEAIRRPQEEWLHMWGKKTTRYQRTVVVEFRDPETGETVFSGGTSKALRTKKAIEGDTGLDNAIESAKAVLDNYDLELVRVVEEGVTKIVFNRPPDDEY